jgi:hypothetical protein
VLANESQAPISVPKQKWRAKTTSVWKEPDEETDPAFDCIFQSKTGNSIRKSAPHSFPAPNPDFYCRYDADRDEKELYKNLVLQPTLSIDLKNRIAAFVQELWDVFREEGVKIPIREYEMVIDTGDHKPVAVRKPHYGLHETPIMQKTILKLIELNFIRPDVISPWSSRITLAPRPHQENISDINEYIWRFCINYIRMHDNKTS